MKGESAASQLQSDFGERELARPAALVGAEEDGAEDSDARHGNSFDEEFEPELEEQACTGGRNFQPRRPRLIAALHFDLC